MAYINPRVAMLLDGILGPKRTPMAPADATARPTAKEYGISDAARRALQKLAEWDTAAGRNVAARLPEGVSLQQGNVPDWIGGPKGIAKAASRVGSPADALTALKRTGPFDAAHALEMGKVRALENAPNAAPDPLPAMARQGTTIGDPNIPDDLFLLANKYVRTGGQEDAIAAARAFAENPEYTSWLGGLRKIYGNTVPVFRTGGVIPNKLQSYSLDPSKIGRHANRTGSPIEQYVVMPEDIAFYGSPSDAEVVINSTKTRKIP